tara:strand:+ start:67 stop:1356 length:1290 start_codon:yes stop_codon:yes gene_type:complete
MLRLIYTVIFYLALPLYFLRLLLRSFKYPEYLKRWNERWGISSDSPSENRKVLWVHAVSVGEVNASIPLIRSMLETYKNIEILVTTTTLTGSQILLNKMGTRVKHQYMPLDLPNCINSFLDTWNPKALLILESEIWPNLIEACNERNIFISLVNARLSEKSKQNYQWVKPLISPVLEKLDLVIAQYESDAKRFKQINPSKEVFLCGNLKFDQDIPEQINSISASIRQSWSVDGKIRPTLIAASTHETEEKFVLDSFQDILTHEQNALLIIVPRHPERFSNVYQQILQTNLEVSRRAFKEEVKPSTKVLLGDTIGELNFLYSLSDIAFVGGSLIDHGGQNLLEPAALGLPICSGASLRNFQDIADELERSKALIIIKNPSDLTDFFVKLILKPEEMKNIGGASKSVFLNNRGAVSKINALLDPQLSRLLN